MAKHKRGKKRSSVSAHRKRFGKAVRACHAETDSASAFGKCMSKKLK